MHIVFDLDFDSGCWPGPLADKEAAIGETWVGPLELLNTLETALGLSGKYPSSAQRVVRLARSLGAIEGFWQQSASVDAISAAKKLLSWRDELWMGGWRGEGKEARLSELARATKNLMPSVPDRIDVVTKMLAHQSVDIERVELFDPLEVLPKTLREMLLALRKNGTEVTVKNLNPAPSKGDLANLLNSLRTGEKFEPQGDGTIVLLRPYGVLNAAEETAAWLASLSGIDKTVIIQPDPVLDAALRRFALPTTGASSPSYSSPLLDIMPLALELGWNPIDPNKAFELLTLPASPIPPSVAHRLASALRVWPAVGSHVWEENLQEGLSKSVEGENREKAQSRIATLFEAKVDRRCRYPLDEVLKRVSLVREWLLGRRAMEEDEEPYSVAINQCTEMEKLLAEYGQRDLSEMELGKLKKLANEHLPSIAPYPAEAGFSHVNSPGSIAGEARQVIWWDFTRSSFSPPETVPLNSKERKELFDLGIHLPSAAERAARAVQRWQRPLAFATERVILVSPKRSQKGEDEYPHPFWDEVTARLSADSKAQRIQQASFAEGSTLIKNERPLHAVTKPVDAFSSVPGVVIHREQESPNSLITLMECPLRYALKYSASLKPGEGTSLARPSDNLLKGNLAHHLLERLLKALMNGLAVTPPQAKTIVEELFEEDTPKLATEFYLPGYDITRASVKRSIGNAAQALADILQKCGAKVEGVEKELQGEALPISIEGRADLVIVGPDAVLDLKWSSASRFRDDLRSGTACQLAAYSTMRHKPGSKGTPAVAYFIIDAGRLLSQDKYLGQFGQVVSGPSAKDTWQAMEKTFTEKFKELSEGKLKAPGNNKEFVAANKYNKTSADGSIILVPRCGFCDFGVVCGGAFLEVQS